MQLLALVGHSDEALAGRARGWRPPRWFCLWMVTASRLGDGWAWVGAAGALLAAGGSHRQALLAVVLAAVATNLLQVPLKRRFRRRRPCDTPPHPLFLRRPRSAPRVLQPWDCYSFPSGHAMNGFALAGVLTLQYPVLGPALVVLAASIGASRVVMGLHYPSDVAAGALLGLAIGGLAYAAILG